MERWTTHLTCFFFPTSPHQISGSISTVFQTPAIYTCASPLHLYLHQPEASSRKHSTSSVNLAPLVCARRNRRKIWTTHLHLPRRHVLSRLTGRTHDSTAFNFVLVWQITVLCCSFLDKCKSFGRKLCQRVHERHYQQVQDITASATIASFLCSSLILGCIPRYPSQALLTIS